MITPTALEALESSGCSLSVKEHQSRELLSTRDGYFLEVLTPFHMVAPSPTLPVEYEDSEEDRLARLCRQRLSPGADITLIDQQIRAQFIDQRTALLYDLLPNDRLELDRQLEIRDTLRNVACAYGGRIWPDDDRLFMFGHPTDALATATESRHRLIELDMPVRAFGIDQGEVLAIEGTVVHWGSPVNTAAKLSEEIATQNEILISDRARYQIQRQFSILEKCVFSPRSEEKSGVLFEHWDVEFTPTEQFIKLLTDTQS